MIILHDHSFILNGLMINEVDILSAGGNQLPKTRSTCCSKAACGWVPTEWGSLFHFVLCMMHFGNTRVCKHLGQPDSVS